MSQANEIKALLHNKYAPPVYAFFTEVGSSTGFANRYIDAVAYSLYPSMHHEIHGFEIKVSRSDFLNEMKITLCLISRSTFIGCFQYQPAAIAYFCQRFETGLKIDITLPQHHIRAVHLSIFYVDMRYKVCQGYNLVLWNISCGPRIAHIITD